MTVYVQKPTFAHHSARQEYYVCGDTLEELHKFAYKMGLGEAEFRSHHELYELTPEQARIAADAGAVKLDDQRFDSKMKFVKQQRDQK